MDIISLLHLDISIYNLILLLSITFLAGIIDAIAGGGGILTIPTLLYIGIPPINALATNKFQSSFGAFSSSRYFIKSGVISLRSCILTIFFTFIGASTGVLTINFLEYMNTSLLDLIIPIFLLLIAIILIFIRLPEGEKESKISFSKFSFIFGLCLGFYDGFFGPGTGTFWTLSYMFFMGYRSIKAVGYTKVMNFTSNFISLIVFVVSGSVIFKLGLLMALFQFVGANIGARITVKAGTKIIKPLVVIVSFIMVIKMGLDDTTEFHKVIFKLL